MSITMKIASSCSPASSLFSNHTQRKKAVYWLIMNHESHSSIINGLNYSNQDFFNVGAKWGSSATFKRYKREILRATACLVTQTQWGPVKCPCHGQSFPPVPWQRHCTVIYEDSPSLWGVQYHKKQDILLVLLTKCSLSVKLDLTQEVSQRGGKHPDIFYTAVAMPDGTIVVIKCFCGWRNSPWTHTTSLRTKNSAFEHWILHMTV